MVDRGLVRGLTSDGGDEQSMTEQNRREPLEGNLAIPLQQVGIGQHGFRVLSKMWLAVQLQDQPQISHLSSEDNNLQLLELLSNVNGTIYLEKLGKHEKCYADVIMNITEYYM